MAFEMALLPEAFATPTVISNAPRAALTRTRIAPQECSSRGASSIGAVVALALGAVRRRHRLRERGLTSLFAKAKAKKAKKAGGVDKNAALAQAKAALEALDLAHQAEQDRAKKKKEKKAKRKAAAAAIKADAEEEQGDIDAKAEADEEPKAEADIDAAIAEKEVKTIADEEAEAKDNAEEEEDKAKAEEIEAKAEAKAKEEEEAMAKAAEAKAKAARARKLMEEADALMAEAKAAEQEISQVEQEPIVESIEESKVEDTSNVHTEVKKEKSTQDFVDLMEALNKNDETGKHDTRKPDSPNGKNLFAFLAEIDTTQAETPKHKAQQASIDELRMQSRKDRDTEDLGLSRTDYHRKMKEADDVEEEEEDTSWLKYYEEDDKDEEVIIKRKRGKGDIVDFNFGEESKVQGEIAIGIKGVSLRLGGRQILQDASWVVKTGEKVAMVGANGCGKTTQLKVLLRELQPDEGEIVESQDNIRYGLLEQGFVDGLDPERTLKEELLAAIPKQADTLRELGEVEEALQSTQDPEEQTRLIDRLGALQADVAAYDTYSLEKRLHHLAEKVGFVEEDLEQKVGLFSGGWKVRIGLTKIFMTAPDVLLLDEPTNHLDMESVEWLETFLKQEASLPIIVVTHDREFMNQVCEKVVETVEGITYTFNGSYSSYVTQRTAKMEKWWDGYRTQVRTVAAIEKFIKQNKNVQATAVQRKKKEMELQKMKESESWLDPPPRSFKQIKFTFPEPEIDQRVRKMRLLASMRNVTHGYTGIDEILFEDASLAVRPSDKIGIVGNNGAGKSTLLRLLMGDEQPSGGGAIQIVDPKQTLYFAQHQADLLPANKTALEVVKDRSEILITETKLVEIMKKFRFKGSRLDTKVEHLSGGERARLAIVCMMLVPSQMLIFDEPTNHLDVPMKETLENAIRAYNGAVVIVSHDRWFLSQTCDKVLEIKDSKVQLYDGDYRFYLDNNLDISLHAQKKYTGLDGQIKSISEAYGQDKKPKGGLRKHQRVRNIEERSKELMANFLSHRGNANR